MKKHGQILDTVDCPGLLPTAVTLRLCFKPKTQRLVVAGFKTAAKLEHQTNKEVVFVVSLLFGFFRDYRHFRWKGGLTITFKRRKIDESMPAKKL